MSGSEVVTPDRAPVLLPPGLERCQHRVDHGLGDVGVGAHDASELVSHSLVLQDFGNAVLNEPGLVGVAQVMEVHGGLQRRQALLVAGEGG